eukprot:4262478-Pleurochrysis_carterae.AAC.7
MASGVAEFSGHLATPSSFVSGTQYLRHVASSFLLVLWLSPSGGARASWSPNASAEVERRVVAAERGARGGSDRVDRCGAGARRKRSLATGAIKEVEVGAVRGGGYGECVSRSASAIAARPPEGPGCTSTSPARRSKSKLKAPCTGAREPRNAATSGGTSRRLGCTLSRAQRAKCF